MVVIKALVSSVLSIALLVFFGLGLLAVIIPSLLSMLLGLLYGVVMFGRVKRDGPLFNLPLVKDLFSYGSKIYAATLIGSLNSYVTNLIVVFYLPPAQVAFFNMGQNKGVLMNKIPDAMSTILFPRVSKTDDHADSAKLIARAFRVALLILSLIGVIAFISFKPIVYILYGRNYLPMVAPFLILLPGVIISSSAGIISQYFAGVGRVDLAIKIPIIPFLVQVVAAILLVPPLGIAGAAVAFLVAMFCLSAIQIAVFLKISGCTLKGDLMIQREDILTVKSFMANQCCRFQTNVLRNLSIMKEKVLGF
jgi:O-antigen/teichoic acid export membrane protein